MVSSDISYYIAVPISYHKDGSIDMVYAEERRKAFAELDELLPHDVPRRIALSPID